MCVCPSVQFDVVLTVSTQYFTIPGTDTTIPVMTLGEDVKNRAANRDRRSDPVSKAIHAGRMPTLRDVKKSVKVCPPDSTKGATDREIIGFAEDLDYFHDADGHITKYDSPTVGIYSLANGCHREKIRNFQTVLYREDPTRL
jgi:hypothetical protein